MVAMEIGTERLIVLRETDDVKSRGEK